MKNLFLTYVMVIFFTNCNSFLSNGYSKDEILQSLNQAVETQDVAKITAILIKHIVETKDEKNRLLIWSIKNDKYQSFKTLLQNNANSNYIDEFKKSPLMYACGFINNKTYMKYAQELINYKANVNYITNGFISEKGNLFKGESPLIIACETGNLSLVKFLIKKGANVEAVTTTKMLGGVYENSAIQSAFVFRNINIVKYLIIEKEVNIRKSFGVNHNGNKIYIDYYLNKLNYNKETEGYKIKLELIEYINKQGNGSD